MLSPKQIAEIINKQENRARIEEDRKRYEIYNGKLREIIKCAIEREFILPETVRELINRIIPVNITQKIVNKLAQVYRESPNREAVNGLETDQEALDYYGNFFHVNRLFKWANRLFKLCKHGLAEPYVDNEGKPKIRILPSHTYTLIGEDPVEPSKPTTIVKHINFTPNDLENDLHVVWNNEQHYVMDGAGIVNHAVMMEMGNPEGINPMGELPFTLVRENDDQLIPMSDDDLISMQIAICLILTDLAFATKYQAWSVIWVKNVDTQKMTFNPNSVVFLNSRDGQPQPEIGTVKPDMDSDAMLRQIEAMVALLLTTKSLSVGSVSAKLEATNSASGVAKMIDQAETTEDRKDQIAYFEEFETSFWNKFAQKILPYWIESGQIDPKYVKRFSDDFEFKITFQDPKPLVSDRERLEVEKLRLETGLTTKLQAIKSTNPGISEENAEKMLQAIRKEGMEDTNFVARNLMDQEEASDLGENQA